jgi:adenosylhomocysteine/aminodeoxyfutalosine nucleosidase
MKLLLLSALQREVGAVARMLGAKEKLCRAPFRAFHARHLSHELTVAVTGVGIESARRAFSRMVQAGRPDGVVSLGYCGSLCHEAVVGDLVFASTVSLVDCRGLETMPLPDPGCVLESLSSRLPMRAGTFLTLKEWMRKERLTHLVPPGMPLPVCEMETFGLAQLSLEHGLPFFAIRAVSDGAGEDIAFDPREVCDASGTYRLSRALSLFFRRPHLLAHAMKLYRGSKRASRSLALAADGLLRIL